MSNYREEKRWSAGSVRALCIRNDYYTNGTIEDYDRMLDLVRSGKPTIDNIEKVALDIALHSDTDRYNLAREELVACIMCDISNFAVTRTYEPKQTS